MDTSPEPCAGPDVFGMEGIPSGLQADNGAGIRALVEFGDSVAHCGQ